jgi:hypothetical protein
MYTLLLYIHILSAVASIGPFLVLIPLLSRLKTAAEPQFSGDLQTFSFVVRLSKHAGHVLVGSGVLLVWVGGWSWVTPWILMTLIILFSALFFIARAFTPTLRQLAKGGQDRDAGVSKLTRSLYAYLLILLLLMWFMVAKPDLW